MVCCCVSQGVLLAAAVLSPGARANLKAAPARLLALPVALPAMDGAALGAPAAGTAIARDLTSRVVGLLDDVPGDTLCLVALRIAIYGLRLPVLAPHKPPRAPPTNGMTKARIPETVKIVPNP
jgi:hypothetical protein